MRRSCPAASFAPELSAGEERVSHSSVSCSPPAFSRKKPCGDSPSMRTTERPFASCPVTTRRWRLGLKDRAASLRLDPDFLHDPAPFLAVGANGFADRLGCFCALGEEPSAVVTQLHDGRAQLTVTAASWGITARARSSAERSD